MPDDVRFALISDLAHRKPYGFADIDALARHIQRDRGENGLQMQDAEDLRLRGDVAARPGVSVYATDADGVPMRLIGHAVLDGLGQEHLRAALRRNRLVLPEEMH